MYNFKTTPYAHQEASFNDSWDAEYYALFMEMGLGKTKVAIDTMGALFEAGRIDCGLILAPKGVYDNWVKREIEEHMPERIDRQIMRWQLIRCWPSGLRCCVGHLHCCMAVAQLVG